MEGKEVWVMWILMGRGQVRPFTVRRPHSGSLAPSVAPWPCARPCGLWSVLCLQLYLLRAHFCFLDFCISQTHLFTITLHFNHYSAVRPFLRVTVKRGAHMARTGSPRNLAAHSLDLEGNRNRRCGPVGLAESPCLVSIGLQQAHTRVLSRLLIGNLA